MLKLINKRLCLSDISAQRRRLHPQRAPSGISGSNTLALDPSKRAGHLVQLSAQHSDELDSLGGLPPIHRTILAHTSYLPGCFWR
jgi:hypothetical protein